MNETYKCEKCATETDTMRGFMIRESGLCFDCYNQGPGKQRRAIREEDKLDEAWFKKAHEVRTPEQLVEFMRAVMDGYVHDYGTVCKAVAACAIAATWCANRMEGANGGITGFQSSAVFWEYTREWQHIKGAARLLKYEDMLYPQNEEHFDKSIDPRTAAWLKDEAQKLLDDTSAVHPTVREHWVMLANGGLPFGYTLREEPDQ